MVIDGNTGSRIISLKLEDEEILGTNDLNTRMYGSTLWLRPQGKWMSHEILVALFPKRSENKVQYIEV